MPPLCSTVRMPRVDRRMRTSCPRLSDSSDVTWRFGRKRRRVLLLAWLTLLPLRTPLPVISQRRDIALNPQYRLEGAGYGDTGGGRQGRPVGNRAQTGFPDLLSLIGLLAQLTGADAGNGVVQDGDDRV